MNFRKICQDYRIPIAPMGHKHQRAGWINVVCPFCTGNPGYHLGFQEDSGGGFVCYRGGCGWHGRISSISALLHVPASEARVIIQQYGGKAYTVQRPTNREYQFGTNVELPLGTSELRHPKAITYLEQRRFDPEKLIRMWGILQTGPVGTYKFRIVIPIKFLGYTVSYTCRSYVGHETRYMSCPTQLEAIPHKEILYGLDEVPSKKRLVVVEGGGPDVWRMGPGCVSTFGTKVTPAQIKIMTNYKRVILLRDLDEAGLLAWEKVAARLRFAGTELVIVDPPAQDPAELTDNEAEYLMRNL